MKTLLFLMSILLNQTLTTPTEIYYGSNAGWYIYYDSQKEINVVEVGGIKYGFLDVLQTSQPKDTIAVSDVGALIFKDGFIRYKNKELNLNIKLNKISYTEKIDTKRYKIYEINAFTIISALKIKYSNSQYKLNSNESYRDNLKFIPDYTPCFIQRFYNEIENQN